MRVVIDTNVFVSSFYGGKPREIIERWKTGEITLCLSQDILDEYVEVLQRLGLEDEDELAELLSLFAKGFNLLFTTKTPRLKVVRRDPSDDKFIECAVALKAEVIITGDRTLEAIKEYMEIRVFTPLQFLKRIEIEGN